MPAHTIFAIRISGVTSRVRPSPGLQPSLAALSVQSWTPALLFLPQQEPPQAHSKTRGPQNPTWFIPRNKPPCAWEKLQSQELLVQGTLEQLSSQAGRRRTNSPYPGILFSASRPFAFLLHSSSQQRCNLGGREGSTEHHVGNTHSH